MERVHGHACPSITRTQGNPVIVVSTTIPATTPSQLLEQQSSLKAHDLSPCFRHRKRTRPKLGVLPQQTQIAITQFFTKKFAYSRRPVALRTSHLMGQNISPSHRYYLSKDRVLLGPEILVNALTDVSEQGNVASDLLIEHTYCSHLTS